MTVKAEDVLRAQAELLPGGRSKDDEPSEVRGARRGRSVTRREAIAAGALAVGVGAAFAVTRIVGAQQQVKWAVIHDGDGGVTAMGLSQNAQQTVSTSYGYNVVVVKDGAVYVQDADCANHDCIGQGAISQAGQQIVCLPHKLWIEVSSSPDGSSSGPDDVLSADSGSDFDVVGR